VPPLEISYRMRIPLHRLLAEARLRQGASVALARYSVSYMTREAMMDRKDDDAPEDLLPELQLSDEDILDAMRHIPGYLDISTQDFRAIYRLAPGHALKRLFRQVSAGGLMRTGIEPLHPDARLDEAARLLASQGRKSLPVVDVDRRVLGMLTETDFLRRFQTTTFLELLMGLLEDQGIFADCCHDTLVSDEMASPAVTVEIEAGFREIVAAFHAHAGRSMPVVDAQGRLQGLLLRKDFVAACHLEDWL
jgi:CBS domain-containing membrane protein